MCQIYFAAQLISPGAVVKRSSLMRQVASLLNGLAPVQKIDLTPFLIPPPAAILSASITLAVVY
jgi:hypothetical protein